jgi:hypothetical protein
LKRYVAREMFTVLNQTVPTPATLTPIRASEGLALLAWGQASKDAEILVL